MKRAKNDTQREKIAVRCYLYIWLMRSKMQLEWRAAMSILARVPVTLDNPCIAEQRCISDCLEEALIETDVRQDEHVARVVVVLPSRVVPQVKVAARLHSRARLAETRSGPGLLENLLHVLCLRYEGPNRP